MNTFNTKVKSIVPEIKRQAKLINISTSVCHLPCLDGFFPDSSEDYTVKVASNVEEACKLLEVGFEYVTEFDGRKLFRKRK